MTPREQDVLGWYIIGSACRSPTARAGHPSPFFTPPTKPMQQPRPNAIAIVMVALCLPLPARAQHEWEVTPEAELALDRGLAWLAANQGPKGNWDSQDLGLVSMGALAFLAAGHSPGRGKYGEVVRRALDYVVNNAKPSGLLNISHSQRDMYNHGLATFVLGQAHGMTTTTDRRLHVVLDRALQLISNTQADDGGWDYRAARLSRGHDLSLVVMQAKALRSAMDSGLDAPPEVIRLAIQSVREHYSPQNGDRNAPESEQRKIPGQFTYGKGGGGNTIAMAAAGVVCLQEFGQYNDWRIEKNMDVITAATLKLPQTPRSKKRDGTLPFDAYTLYYVGQAAYQVGGEPWKANYPRMRDYLVSSQVHTPGRTASHGSWHDRGALRGGRVSGTPGDLYGTSVACFILAIPNRYLPILQEGQIESLKRRFETP